MYTKMLPVCLLAILVLTGCAALSGPQGTNGRKYVDVEVKYHRPDYQPLILQCIDEVNAKNTSTDLPILRPKEEHHGHNFGKDVIPGIILGGASVGANTIPLALGLAVLYPKNAKLERDKVTLKQDMEACFNYKLQALRQQQMQQMQQYGIREYFP